MARVQGTVAVLTHPLRALGFGIFRPVARDMPPAFEPSSEAREAFFLYQSRKTLSLEGQQVCPHTEALLRGRNPADYVCYEISSTEHGSNAARTTLPKRIGFRDAVSCLLRLHSFDWRDLYFVFRIVCATPRRFVPGRVKWLWAVRTYLAAWSFSQKCRYLADTHTAAYVMDYYSGAMLGVVMAFRLKGKKVWEIQHGTISATHAAYAPGLFKVTSSFQPTGLIVWDERFAGYARKYLGLEATVTNYAHLRLASTDLRRARTSRVILYTLQIDTQFPSQVLEAVERFDNVLWKFRLHPLHKQDDIMWRSFSSLPRVSLSTVSNSLADDLIGSDLHITFNSSVVHEAVALGMQSLVLDTSSDLFGEEIASGHVTMLEPDHLASFLSNWLEG